MRIGLFTDTYLPDINGVVSSVELLRKKLTEAGHEDCEEKVFDIVGKEVAL